MLDQRTPNPGLGRGTTLADMRLADYMAGVLAQVTTDTPSVLAVYGWEALFDPFDRFTGRQLSDDPLLALV